jgi:hypothetical protein
VCAVSQAPGVHDFGMMRRPRWSLRLAVLRLAAGVLPTTVRAGFPISWDRADEQCRRDAGAMDGTTGTAGAWRAARTDGIASAAGNTTLSTAITVTVSVAAYPPRQDHDTHRYGKRIAALGCSSCFVRSALPACVCRGADRLRATQRLEQGRVRPAGFSIAS